jgi:hypothetical protein
MQLAAIIKARTLAFLDIHELNKEGAIRFADIVPKIVDRYGFLAFPGKFEDFDFDEKGVVFNSGRLRDVVIDKLKIFSGVIYVETLSSTDDSQRIIIDMMTWGRDELGFTSGEEIIRHWAYVSQVTFFSKLSLIRAVSSPIDRLAAKTGAEVSKIFNETIVYHPFSITIGHDPTSRRNTVSSFLIQQRASVPFEDNKFFSEAPLPTKIHLKFLSELENDCVQMRGGR